MLSSSEQRHGGVRARGRPAGRGVLTVRESRHRPAGNFPSIDCRAEGGGGEGVEGWRGGPGPVYPGRVDTGRAGPQSAPAKNESEKQMTVRSARERHLFQAPKKGRQDGASPAF